MQNKQSSVSGFVHLLKSAATRQVEVKEKAQALTCLDQAGIEALEDKWNWSELSKSNEVLWSIALIEQFKDQWKWKDLSTNSKLPWSVELIERFKDQWKWKELSGNSKLPWSVELVEQFKDRWDWTALSSNSGLPWSAELIAQFKDQLKWNSLSGNRELPWSAELIEQFKGQWKWTKLSSNRELPWSAELIEQYKDRWDWKELLNNHAVHIEWSAELIEHYKDRWDWKALSGNSGLEWSAELIEQFIDRWDWKVLSGNTRLPWSAELIEQYKDRWNWTELSYLYDGELIYNDDLGLKWSPEFIEQYKDYLDWEVLSTFEELPWSLEFLVQYKDYLDTSEFYDNRTVCECLGIDPDQDVDCGDTSDQIIVRFPFARSNEDGGSRPNITDFSEEELSDPRACFSLILSWEPEEMGNQDEDDWDEGDWDEDEDESDHSDVKIIRIEILYDGVTPFDSDGEIGYWFKDGELCGYPEPIVRFTFDQEVSAEDFITAINRSSFQTLTAAMREKDSEPYTAEDHNGYVVALDMLSLINTQFQLHVNKAFCGKVFEFPDGLPSYGYALSGTDFILERQSWIKH